MVVANSYCQLNYEVVIFTLSIVVGNSALTPHRFLIDYFRECSLPMYDSISRIAFIQLPSSITIVVIVTYRNYHYQLGNPIVSWVILLYSRVNYVSSNQQLLSWRGFMFEPLNRYHSRSRNRCVHITCLLGINPSYSYSFLACFCATRIPILNNYLPM